MLYKTMQRFKLKADDAFQNIDYSLPEWKHATKDVHGVWQVPKQGTVELSFNVERGIEVAVQGISDSDFTGFITHYYALTRLTPSFKKAVVMLSRWKDLNGLKEEQRVFVRSLATDFTLSLGFVRAMVETAGTFASETIMTLFPCIPLDVASKYLVQQLYPSIGAFVKTHMQMRKLLHFNFDNPTGNYALNLNEGPDYEVAAQLILLDSWEALIDKRNKRTDVSPMANRSHFRNEHYQSQPLWDMCESVADWCLPEYGDFCFDYVSSHRPPAGVQVLGDDTFTSLLIDLYEAECTPANKIVALRMISHLFYITAKQMRQMLGFFFTAEERAEAFIFFFFRIVDQHNQKVFLVRFDSDEEVYQLQARLGFASFFPFIQPENRSFTLNYFFHDQRICATLLVQLTQKERPDNILYPVYTREDGTEDELPLGVPQSWQTYEGVPRGGTFEATYVCAPEFRAFEFRKAIAKTYGYFNMDIKQAEVQWWTGLTEVPEDVLKLVEFLMGENISIDKAFIMIDGVGGNEEITMQELQEGLEEMNCHKFDGPDKEKRIEKVFRYLDPGREGSVSKFEWDVLGQLWNEFDFAVREFVQFLERTFDGDMTYAWDVLDTQDKGELDVNDWMLAIADLGYFGPARIIFSMLDTSDDGNIQLEEFETLEKYLSNYVDHDAE